MRSATTKKQFRLIRNLPRVIAVAVPTITERHEDFALSDISMAVRLDPEDASSYIVRGCIQSITSNDLAAIADFTKAIELNPMISTAYVDRAMVCESSDSLP